MASRWHCAAWMVGYSFGRCRRVAGNHPRLQGAALPEAGREPLLGPPGWAASTSKDIAYPTMCMKTRVLIDDLRNFQEIVCG